MRIELENFFGAKWIISKTCLKQRSQYWNVMNRDNAEKQKKKAQDMLGITDDRADEIFEETESRTQKKKKELQDQE